MVYERINFVMGYLYTKEELIARGVLEVYEEGTEDEYTEINEDYNGQVHEWHHESPEHEKLYVIGKVIHTEARKHGVHCGECDKLHWPAYKEDGKACIGCVNVWRGHKRGEEPEWCDECFSKISNRYPNTPELRYMKSLTVCNACLGSCVHGDFDVVHMNESVVTFDGFPGYSSKRPWTIPTTEKRDCMCFNCHIPSLQVAHNETCKWCGYDEAFRDDYPRSYDNSFVGREGWRVRKITAEFGKGDDGKKRELHVFAMVDDCFCCS